MQGYSTTVGYGVTKILQESKTLQINIFFSEVYKLQGYSNTIWYGVTKSLQDSKTFQINILFNEVH